jgi:hypothetical protein
MVLNLPIKPEISHAKDTAVHDFPSESVSIFPSYFPKFSDFFLSHSRRRVMLVLSFAALCAGKIALISCNISVA